MLNAVLRRPAAGYAAAFLLSSVATYVLLGVGHADLAIPFAYGGDSLSVAASVKAMADGTWFSHNKFIGLPSGLDLCDYPIADNFHYVLLKILVTILPTYGVALNVYYLLTFPLTTLTSLVVFRQFRVPYGPALVGSLLYPFLQFHFRRSLDHLFLGSYYFIPLMIMVALWVMDERPPFFEAEGTGLKPRLARTHRRSLVALAIGFLMASFGVYYAAFSAFLLLVAGATGAAHHRSARNLVSAGTILVALVVGLGVNLAPSLVQRLAKGKNHEIATRSIADAEYYALRFTPMLLPISEHRIPALGRLRDKYNNAVGDVRENDMCALGFLGAAGFLFLLWRLFAGRKKFGGDEFDGTLSGLGVLGGAGLLLGTVGGFGVLFAVLVTPLIRSYNRISIFLAFFAFFAVAILLARMYRKVATTHRRVALATVGLAAIGVLGVLDQTSPRFRPAFDVINPEFKRDAAYFQKIEPLVPAGSWIAQLPYVAYPEGGNLIRMRDYDHLKAYLHSKTLRWSYGAEMGRSSDRWQRETFSKPAPVMLRILALSGFGGLYIDRFGFGDGAAALIGEVRTILGTAPVDSDDGRRAFFPLQAFAEGLRAQTPAETWEHLRAVAPTPLEVTAEEGCSRIEGTYQVNWRWCGPEALFTIENTTSRARMVLMTMTLRTGHPEESDFVVEGELFVAALKVNNSGVPFSREFVVPPGKHIVKMRSTARRVDAPRDSRVLVFRSENIWTADLGPAPVRN